MKKIMKLFYLSASKRARGKRRGFSLGAAARHSQSARVYTYFVRKHSFCKKFGLKTHVEGEKGNRGKNICTLADCEWRAAAAVWQGTLPAWQSTLRRWVSIGCVMARRKLLLLAMRVSPNPCYTYIFVFENILRLCMVLFFIVVYSYSWLCTLCQAHRMLD